MTDVGSCGCARCDDACRSLAFAETGNHYVLISRRMILCPVCGNKRCPRASWHGYDCTRSNEPGQEGSNYGGQSSASTYFDVLRMLTSDPDLLAIVAKVEDEVAAEANVSSSGSSTNKETQP